MARRKRKRRAHEGRWVERKQLALDMEETIRHSAEYAGMRLRVSVVRCGKTEFPHWMFEDARCRRLLDFWPTAYTWRNPNTGEKGAVESLSDALEVALDYAERVALLNAQAP